jgi:hypothetical protein
MRLMKLLLLSIIALMLRAEGEVKEGFARSQHQYRSDACTAAKQQARARYAIVEMDPGCRCEKGDDRQWQCDVGFTYRTKKSSQ